MKVPKSLSSLRGGKKHRRTVRPRFSVEKTRQSLYRWWKEARRKHRFSMRNATDGSEEWHIHLSPASIFAAFVAFALVLFILLLILTAYTPILEFLPGYRTEAARSRDNLIHNVMRLDSMERMMNDMMTYNENIALIMDGKTPVVRTVETSDSTRIDKTLVMPSHEDSLLRLQMEGDGPYGLSGTNSAPRSSVRSFPEMVTPVEGILTDRFDIKQGKLGVRIATDPNANVTAIEGGTVVMSIWSPDNGNIVQLQHPGSLLSVYKHLSRSLVAAGQTVRSGEVIGSASDTDKNHQAKAFEFELWNNGKPVDPERYIIF